MAGLQEIGRSVHIDGTARLKADQLKIGSGTIIGPGVVIEGAKVIIGRESWLDYGAYIGGGSAFDPSSYLTTGDFLHMGRNSHINTARGVEVGDEFGCGVETKVFGHGAYLSELDGFPVSFRGIVIGDRVWLPNAWVNPGVKIGSNVVVAARSLVNINLPSGCLAAGIPCRVIRENRYPAKLTVVQKRAILNQIAAESGEIAAARGIANEQAKFETDGGCENLLVGETIFDLTGRTINGEATRWTEIVKNQLRRHGVRFKCWALDGIYVGWDESGY